ncbi:DUF1990 family protein [Oerskovia flava]|uniref:DUF1990 family protein n=1 Tax=Oerskovia flava TaxID=2986422 RepID=UPI00223FF79E|nr:DUF1990 domain-containing protein [Oerskovia sp. JB1-3-2]
MTEQKDLTYPEVGATLTGDLPTGYAHLHVRHRLSGRARSPADLAWLGEQLLTWRVHAAAAVRLDADGPVAVVGGRVATHLGIWGLGVVEPCEIVWVERTPEAVAFGYGTLPGHAFTGEERFAIERDQAGDLWLAIDVFSNPALWWLRPLRSLLPVFQRLFAANLARGARRLLRSR